VPSYKRKETEMATPVIDPVCGMTVDPDRTPHKSEYEGTTYYFCSPGCKKAFEAEPATYLRTDDGSR